MDRVRPGPRRIQKVITSCFVVLVKSSVEESLVSSGGFRTGLGYDRNLRAARDTWCHSTDTLGDRCPFPLEQYRRRRLRLSLVTDPTLPPTSA